jgi:hypothetical protein
VVELFQVAVYRSQLVLVDPALESAEPVPELDVAGAVALLDWPEVPVLSPVAAPEDAPAVEVESVLLVAEPVVPDAVEPVPAEAVPAAELARSDAVEVALEPACRFALAPVAVASGVAVPSVAGAGAAGAGAAAEVPGVPVAGTTPDGAACDDHGRAETGAGRLSR